MTSENYRDLELEGLKDTGLQAFMLHKLGRENPVRILQASQSVIDVLKGFDPPLALRTLDRLVETMGAKFVPFLQQLLKHDDRPIIRARVLYHLSRKDPSESTQRILNQVLNGIDHPRVRASCLSGLSRVRSKIPLKHIKSHLLNEDTPQAHKVSSADPRSADETLCA